MCVKKLGKKIITKKERSYWKVFMINGKRNNQDILSPWHKYHWIKGLNYAIIFKESILKGFFGNLNIPFDTGFFCFKKEKDAYKYALFLREENHYVKKVFIPADTMIQHIEDEDNAKCIITPVLILGKEK